ncbi:MAG TPA: TIGR04295 family B12-binding domain-containing radical SAM protein [Hyphomicrobiaceae bacterium]|nr:TIGR04295 family B12-binding domain-containing radical SAM protein [Hyphomicrobiaceae bacterium]
MRIVLVNPPWDYRHSIYFGCRAPHLPLELGYAKALLERAGHTAVLVDAHALNLDCEQAASTIAELNADMTVVTTAPTYLFWRCAPPELRVPRQLLDALGDSGGARVAVGPHGSATPRTTLRKLDADIVVCGECEDAIVELTERPPRSVPGVAFREAGNIIVTGPPRAVAFTGLAALHWDAELIRRHRHHHHRFDEPFFGPGAEVEASRGCPYACTFCAKMDYRDKYRRRELPLLLEEIDALIAQGVGYVYFVDEIFLPNRSLLEALRQRDVVFGVQTRIDLWKPDMLDLLGAAGCVSIEASVESLTREGRATLSKNCRLSTDELAERLIRARETVPFVQANLIAMADDEAELVARWRERLQGHGVWANDPVPLYPYPSSPDYRRLFGLPDEHAWERAHAHYLAQFRHFSDLQDDHPLPLQELEAACC